MTNEQRYTRQRDIVPAERLGGLLKSYFPEGA